MMPTEVRPPAAHARGTVLDGPQLLLWSGPDARREERMRSALSRYLDAGPDGLVSQAAGHLGTRSTDGRARGAVVASTAVEAVRLLGRFEPPPVRAPRPVVLVFPGQGAQYPRMAAGLYDREPVFTAAMDEVFTLLGPRGAQLRADWLSADPSVEMDDGTRAQPLLFAVGYALGRMVEGWGIRPAALLGHSVGEMVAATLAGVFQLADVVRLIEARIDALKDMPPGGMLAVAASADEVRALLPTVDPVQVVVAAINAPRQTLVAGPDAELDEVETTLRAAGLTCRRAKAKQGFHSPMMRVLGDATESAVAAANPQAPTVPLYSAYTGGRLRDETARDVRFWSRQLADPVLYWPALDALLANGDVILVEAGPGQSLTALAKQHPNVRRGASAAVALLPARPGDAAQERHAVLSAAARLWLDGHRLRRDAFLDNAMEV
jgi:[acyl-carrier-protein] S-malonyltransferase